MKRFEPTNLLVWWKNINFISYEFEEKHLFYAIEADYIIITTYAIVNVILPFSLSDLCVPALVVCQHSLCASTRFVPALVVCQHSLCASTRYVPALVVCQHSYQSLYHFYFLLLIDILLNIIEKVAYVVVTVVSIRALLNYNVCN